MSIRAPLFSTYPLRPLKYLASLRGAKVDVVPEDGEYLGLEQIESWTGKLSNAKLQSHPEGSANVFRKNDVLFGKLRPYLAKGWVAERDGFCTGESLVLVPNNADARFIRYCLLTEEVISSIDGSTFGSKMPRADWGFIGNVQLPVPPQYVQAQISNFLDEQTARIDALIAEKKRLALAVREFEQAQISQLLAQGLLKEPQAETGNIYVPAAPSHWRVVPFKRALRGMEQGWSPQCDSRPAVGNEWGVLKVGCVNGTRFNPEENKALPTDLTPDLSCVIRPGDVLVSRANTRELVGSAAIVWGDFPNLLLCDKLYRLKLASDWVMSEFAVLLLRADTARRQIELGASGASSSMQNISQDVIRELVVALPPLNEQTQIVDKAKSIRAKADDLANHVEEHIGRLREYRASLISAAVSGRLDINLYKEAA